jgi:hypothetical protein
MPVDRCRGIIDALDECGPVEDVSPWGGWMRWLFGPIELGSGRIQVWGCSPGCLLLSLLVSVILTILLNLVLDWF